MTNTESPTPEAMTAHLAEVEALLVSGEPLEIGAYDIPGIGLRIVMGAGGKMLAMDVAAARSMADTFDDPAAIAAGLTVADDLRTAADFVEAHGATVQ